MTKDNRSNKGIHVHAAGIRQFFWKFVFIAGLSLHCMEVTAQLANYSFRKSITIDHTMVSGGANHTDFPFLINLTDADLRSVPNGGSVTSSSGFDIAFTAADGLTPLDHELEMYTAATGQLIAWVRIPTLGYNVDTDIYMYYGNATASTDPSSTGTWDGNYKGVWHVDEEVGGTGTSDLYEDGSANANDGNDEVSDTGSSGKVGRGQQFDGSDDYIDCGSDASLNITTAVTLEAWVYMPDIPAKGDWFNVFGKEHFFIYMYRPWSLFPTNTVLGAVVNIDGVEREIDEFGSITLPDDTWIHLAITYDGSTIRGYVNGVADGTYNDSGSITSSSGEPLYIGRFPGETENMDGYLDELRVSSVARSADWIKTGFDNQNNPTSFVSVGSTEVMIAPGDVASGMIAWYKGDGGTTVSTQIDLWADQSGYNHHLTATGDPQLIEEGLNFNPAAEFDGTGDIFNTSDGGILQPGLTYDDVSVFIVSTANESSNSMEFVELTSAASGPRFGAHLPYNNGNLYWDYPDFATGRILTAETVTDGDPYVFSLLSSRTIGQNVLEATDYKQVNQNGATIMVGTSQPNSETGTAGEFSLGLNVIGKIAEFIVYDKVVTATEISQIESYLAIKYGITLEGGSNYLASDGSTILWNATTNSGYHNDVAGIGRDDGSVLEQQQSLSSNPDGMLIMDKGGSFTSDLDFILWGNDGGAASLTVTDKHPDYDSRLDRVWKAAVTGSPGDINIRIIFPGNTGAAINYALHVDEDGTFADGSTEFAATGVSGDTITFDGVPLSDGDFFTLGQVGSGPGGVSTNLRLWLLADVATSSSTDGANISSWEDQSGNANTMSQSTGSDQPTFRDNSTDNINFNPVMDFDGMDDYLTDASGILGTGTYDDFNLYVVKVTDVVQDEFLFNENTSYQRISAHIPWNDGTFYWDPGGYDGAYRLSINWGGTAAIPYLWGALSSTTSSQTISGISQAIQRDGLTLNSDNDAGSITGNNSTFSLGSINGTANFMNGKIAELVIYTGPISAAQHIQIQSYLAIKYGITLDNSAGNYVASDGTTTLWNATTNASYHNDVAGIG